MSYGTVRVKICLHSKGHSYYGLKFSLFLTVCTTEQRLKLSMKKSIKIRPTLLVGNNNRLDYYLGSGSAFPDIP